MSVIPFSKAEIESIMSSLFRNYRIYLWTEQERCMFIEHARHHNQLMKTCDESEDTQEMDHLRWTFERIYLANQLQFKKNYAHGYGKKFEINYECLEFVSSDLSLVELHKKLYSLRYNSDEFINENDSDSLNRWIYSLASQIAFKVEDKKYEALI